MGGAAAAIGTAEPCHGRMDRGQSERTINQIAFLAIREHKNTLYRAGDGQMINMPMPPLVGSQMTPQPCRQATGSIGAAEIKIGSRRQCDLAQRANFTPKPTRQPNQHPIGTGTVR